LGYESVGNVLPPSVSLRETISEARVTGSGRSRTALMTLKMAVLAPMPSASVKTATAEKSDSAGDGGGPGEGPVSNGPWVRVEHVTRHGQVLAKRRAWRSCVSVFGTGRPACGRSATCDNRQNMLHCREVTKRFGEFVALDNISFDLAGGICALLGPNGAGKSTLLKILTGLLAPDRGEVLIAGRDVAKEPLRVKRTIGVLPEDLGVFDALTIEEHLELCGPVYGLSRKETHERAGANSGLGKRPLYVSRSMLPRDAQEDRAGHGIAAQSAPAAARRTV